MARYVMSHRLSGLDMHERLQARDGTFTAFNRLFLTSSDLISESPAKEGPREIIIFDASPEEVAAKASLAGPDVILEPEILHFPVLPTALPPDLRTLSAGGGSAARPAAGAGQTLTVTITGPHGPLYGSLVTDFLRGRGNRRTKITALTDRNGSVSFACSSYWSHSALIVEPAGGHWSMIVRGPSDGMVISVPELPRTGPRAWWHAILGIDGEHENLGSGMVVGIIDTGAGPHPCIAHVQPAGAFLGGKQNPSVDAIHDVDSHGSHVAGTIGGHAPKDGEHPAGIAPGSELVIARVFAQRGEGANQGDIANAIDWLSDVSQADLINMSLGAPIPSTIARDAIEDAVERGTLIICAAGNGAGTVDYPGRFPETAAVSAIGIEGWGPPGSVSASRYPEQSDRYGDHRVFLANFSSYGDELECAAPGVGIISTAPERFGLQAPYIALDGTSMASPVACGALAALLAQDAGYLALPRDATRSSQARAVLRRACRDMGLASRYQGYGLPTVV